MLYSPDAMYITSKVKLIYNQDGKIVLRIGNLSRVAPTTGFAYKFLDDIADTVVYQNNAISVTQILLSTDLFTKINPYQRDFFFEHGRLTKELADNESYGTETDPVKDTILFYYNKAEQIDSTKRYGLYFQENKNFFYNENGNLEKVIGKTFWKDNKEVKYNDTILFSDYDNTPNLTGNLILFDECFYRSLSKNNFKKYIYKRYDAYKQLLQDDERTWQFSYDAENYPEY